MPWPRPDHHASRVSEEGLSQVESTLQWSRWVEDSWMSYDSNEAAENQLGYPEGCLLTEDSLQPLPDLLMPWRVLCRRERGF